MTRPLRGTASGFAVAVLSVALAASLAGQSPGNIEFTAQVTPTGGRPEPVRQITFYALRMSFAEIRQETLRSYPSPDFNSFIDGLSCSKELKAWMKDHRTAQLAGPEFTGNVKASDIVNVPEFFDAYMARNAAFEGVGFPKPKFKEKERAANPEKYKQQKEEYTAALTKFVTAMPDTVQGIDADLTAINPYEKWAQVLEDHARLVEKRSLELAQTRYLAAQADTSLDGRGAFVGLGPGDYWITTLGLPAAAGDIRLSWDVRVTVRPGETTRASLTNLNAMESNRAASHPNP